MFKRQQSGSVLCTSCGVLVGVGDDRCYNCGRRNPGLWGFAPALRALGRDLGFVPFVIGTCVVIYVLTIIASRGAMSTGGILNMFGPSGWALFLFGGTGPEIVFLAGRWWTLLSASWLHAGILHIFMNMMAARSLAPAVADMYGPGRMVIIYVLSGVAGFFLSVMWGAYLPPIPIIGGGGGLTIGASASLSGMIGAIYYYGKRGGSGMARTYALNSVVMLIVMGFLIPNINNLAHAGGFFGGYLTSQLLDPLKPERIDHIVVAVALLGVSLLSVVVSVVTGMQYLQN